MKKQEWSRQKHSTIEKYKSRRSQRREKSTECEKRKIDRDRNSFCANCKSAESSLSGPQILLQSGSIEE